MNDATATNAVAIDDVQRNTYCIFGLPIDAIDMATVLLRIEAAAANQRSFLISTPNLDFLANSLSDAEFRESLLDSDLCPPDGMPILWIARLIGVPIKQRVSGSDIFEMLKLRDRGGHRLKVLLFGGAEGIAETAAKSLNKQPSGLSCVGAINPGFGTVEAMSRDEIIDRVNSSGADFLAVALGAKKGQVWLYRNHKRLTVSVRAHLGAAINIQAGAIKRAPLKLQKWGLEWLWRIKEEPYLWRRYMRDGSVLLYLLLTRVLLLAVLSRWYRLKSEWNPQELLIRMERRHDLVIIRLFGDANERNIGTATAFFQESLTSANAGVVIDFAGTRVIDGRFLGLLLMVRKKLKAQGAKPGFVGVSPAIRRLFWLNDLYFLLNS